MPSIQEIHELFLSKFALVEGLEDLEHLRIEFLGKKGLVSEALLSISKALHEERQALGKSLNHLKMFVTSTIEEKKQFLEERELDKKLKSESIDVTLPARRYKRGKIHPISRTILEVKQIFKAMGFKFVEGPDIDNDHNNFTALNISAHHPARQTHDTFYTEGLEGEEELLLRTHTSTVQIRYMSNNPPPLRIVSIGKVYRADSDATHTPMFHQIEGLCIEPNVTMAHLKGTLETFLQLFFEVEAAPIRLRPSYFPFTEPSAEVDVKCDRSNTGSIKIGTGADWLELLGCGMVSPQVLKNVAIDPKQYQGFAFGMGIDRLAMLKYNIADLRSCFEGDIRWLNYWGT